MISLYISNFHSPIKEKLQEGINVLDSGCGPGTWTFDMAEQYPNSKFTAIDISFVFPEIVGPPNVDMHIMNVAKELAFKDNSFDFMFQRFLLAGLTRSNWKQVKSRIIKHHSYKMPIDLLYTFRHCKMHIVF